MAERRGALRWVLIGLAVVALIALGYLLNQWLGAGLGQVAGFLAAVAFLILAIGVAYPLVRLATVFDQLKSSVKEITDETLPVIGGLEETVGAANLELGKLAVVTEDVAKVSGHISAVAGDTSRVSKLVADTVVVPFIKLKSLSLAAKRAINKSRK